MWRNVASSVTPYTILSAPPISRGHGKVEAPSRYPEIVGLSAAARLRGTDVRPAAAGKRQQFGVIVLAASLLLMVSRMYGHDRFANGSRVAEVT
jgi:hypothetical protein